MSNTLSLVCKAGDNRPNASVWVARFPWNSLRYLPCKGWTFPRMGRLLKREICYSLVRGTPCPSAALQYLSPLQLHQRTSWAAPHRAPLLCPAWRQWLISSTYQLCSIRSQGSPTRNGCTFCQEWLKWKRQENSWCWQGVGRKKKINELIFFTLSYMQGLGLDWIQHLEQRASPIGCHTTSASEEDNWVFTIRLDFLTCFHFQHTGHSYTRGEKQCISQNTCFLSEHGVSICGHLNLWLILPDLQHLAPVPPPHGSFPKPLTTYWNP